MSTYHSYRFRAPIADPTIADVETFMAASDRASVWFTLHTEPDDYRDVPGFGSGARYEGPGFGDLSGITVSDGILGLGFWQENMLRDRSMDESHDLGDGRTVSFRRPSDDGVEITPPSGSEMSDLDRLLTFLSKVTTGVAGEIQGCFSSENDDFGHAHPIVRCADGGLRVWSTPVSDHELEGYHGVEPVPVLGCIPSDLTAGPYDGSWVRIDLNEMLRRIEPIDVSPASTMSVRPSRGFMLR